jgi:hypothetical protein
MSGPPLWRASLPYIVIGLLDVFAIGLGMGVPVLAIVYGAGLAGGLCVAGHRCSRMPYPHLPGRWVRAAPSGHFSVSRQRWQR